jgi:hypothetical protein
MVASCRKGNCSLRVPKTGVLCFDCDSCDAFAQDEPHPDLIILYSGASPDSLLWLVVEIKSSTAAPNHILTQLQAGADAIQSKIAFNASWRTRRLIPVVLRKGNGRSHVDDLTVLRSRMIRFDGRDVRVQLA